MAEPLTIPASFEGLPGVILGGYSAGLLARAIGPSAEVALRRPIKTSTELQITPSEDGFVLRDDELIYAEGRAVDLSVDVPTPVSVAEAEAAAMDYPGFAGHFFPRCYCCGPERQLGDGLRIFPGSVGESNTLAAPWTPHPSLAGTDGDVPPELLWAALDCPGIWALIADPSSDPEEKALTAGMAVTIEGRVQAGQPHVVMGWPMGRDGRRVFAGAAILSGDGEVLCAARQTMVLTDRGVPLGLKYWRGSRGAV
jgi:hypothetical protein